MIDQLIWLAMLGIPLLLALMIPFGGRVRALAIDLMPFAAIPALIIAALPDMTYAIPIEWLLLGSIIGLEQTSQIFLLLTATLWTAAGIYARYYHADDPDIHRFAFFFLLTMTGNLGLIVAIDVVTFYTTFALMTFSAYGLVVHTRSAKALRAGKVYIVMAVIGEAFLLVGLFAAAWSAEPTRFIPAIHMEQIRQGIIDSPYSNLIIGCLLAGFGIKAGAIPLHVWLPLAHPVAPTAASAVLSGAMIKAGLLGWIKFLPIGETELVGWGTLLVVISLSAAFFGVVIGLTQDDPKTLLAYSSISQMGFIATAVAVGMASPDAWGIALIGCALYALHHGLIKGALFLGVGVAHEVGTNWRRQRVLLAGLTLVAISLAGAPLTTGALAKTALKEGVYLGPAGWSIMLDWLLPVAAIGTTVLMGRFLWLIWRHELGHIEHGQFAGMALPWGALLILSFPVVWLAPRWYDLDVPAAVAFEPMNLWTSTWPVLVGGVILFVIWLRIARTDRIVSPIRIPAGDLIVPLEWVLARIRPKEPEEVVPRPPDPVAALSSTWYGLFAEAQTGSRTFRLSGWLVRWDVAGLFFLSIGLALVTLMVWW
jgi:formate hydrogenlyase subunit 3/multisubunit Na+/H+ antiporter MnhD subunit